MGLKREIHTFEKWIHLKMIIHRMGTKPLKKQLFMGKHRHPSLGKRQGTSRLNPKLFGGRQHISRVKMR